MSLLAISLLVSKHVSPRVWDGPAFACSQGWIINTTSSTFAGWTTYALSACRQSATVTTLWISWLLSLARGRQIQEPNPTSLRLLKRILKLFLQRHVGCSLSFGSTKGQISLKHTGRKHRLENWISFQQGQTFGERRRQGDWSRL